MSTALDVREIKERILIHVKKLVLDELVHQREERLEHLHYRRSYDHRQSIFISLLIGMMTVGLGIMWVILLK